MTEFHIKAAGVTFEGRQRVLSRLNVGDKLVFKAEPGNIHDSSAVRIETEDGIQVGFVPRDRNANIFRNLMHQAGTYQVEVSAVTGGGFDTNYGVNMVVRYYPAGESTCHTTVEKEPAENDTVREKTTPFPEQICPICGSLAKSESSICPNCGYSFEEGVHAVSSAEPAVPADSVTEATCPECGGLIKPKMLACPDCGFPRELLSRIPV